MPGRKGSRNGFDYATYADPRGFHRGYYGQYQMQPYYAGAPTNPYHPQYNGYVNNGYGTWYSNAYGADGFHYMRGYDPSYDAFYTEGPSVDDKWRSTYPYVPTSYSQHTVAPDRSNVGGSRSRSGRGDTSGGGETDQSTVDEGSREHWGSKWEFIFSCVGLSVGIGNVWRFPYLAYQNGGAAFLLPYFILLLLIGKPMYFMEVALGQFSQLGPLQVWKPMSPIGRGVGFAMCTLSLIVAIYYNVVMGYCLHYMFASFTSVLPWSSCDPSWGADLESCYSGPDRNCTASVCQPASEQYWERFVLGINQAPLETDPTTNKTYNFPVFGEIGEIKWDLSLCLLLSWIIVFACLSKGIKSSGKVVYFTATFPYVILIILLVRGLLLDGAVEGLTFLFKPRWEQLLDITVWRNAAEQMFFSLSVSWGGLIMFGSYNKFRHRVHYPAMIISSLDFLTSIVASIVVFSILGELKLKGGYDSIEEVVSQKQGLAFVAYPEVILHLAVPQLWAVLFFFMLFTLGLDSEFAFLETILTAICDMFPKMRNHKTAVCLVVCCACYLLSIPCVSYSGQYVFDLMDTYGGGLGVLWVAIFETVVIMWIYGVGRFADDLKFMLQINVGWYLKICWAITPILLTAIFAIAAFYWTPPTYKDSLHGEVHYPVWAHSVGWFLTLLVGLQIPVIAIIMVIYFAAQGKVKAVVQPTNDWGPGDKVARQEWIAYKYRKAMQCKRHPYAGYDNYGMNYPMNYYGGSYHM